MTTRVFERWKAVRRVLSSCSPGGVGLVLQRLERQHGGADLAALAVPHQLHLALVLEQDEAILLRQRFSLLDEPDQVALLGVGEVVAGLEGRGISDPEVSPQIKL